jgi:hypothetical protein
VHRPQARRLQLLEQASLLEVHGGGRGGGWGGNRRELRAQDAGCELPLWPAPRAAAVRCTGPKRVAVPAAGLACAPAAVCAAAGLQPALRLLARATAFAQQQQQQQQQRPPPATQHGRQRNTTRCGQAELQVVDTLRLKFEKAPAHPGGREPPGLGGLPTVVAQSYELVVSPDDAPSVVEVAAASAEGLRWGLGAVAQLLHAAAAGGATAESEPESEDGGGAGAEPESGGGGGRAGGGGGGGAWLPLVRLVDGPRFPYRGLLLDTAHHGGSVKLLQRAAAMAAACRLNVLHWHWSDTQAFQLELPSHPELAAAGGGGGGGAPETYRRPDVLAVREWAESRGVQVLPELELGGHANGGWAAAHPGLAAVGPAPGRVERASPSGPSYAGCSAGKGNLDPTNASLVKVVGELVADLFPAGPEGKIHRVDPKFAS